LVIPDQAYNPTRALPEWGIIIPQHRGRKKARYKPPNLHLSPGLSVQNMQIPFREMDRGARSGLMGGGRMEIGSKFLDFLLKEMGI
jgi:hypothetical protein